jgi:predicted anti-sigma-YlaC factor YlaD
MRCRDAKQWLTAQRETEPEQTDVLQVQEHLKRCSGCHSFGRRQANLNTLLEPVPSRAYSSISTERIMQAIEQQKRVSQQLETIQNRQQARLAHMSKAGPKIAVMAFLVTGAFAVGLFFLFLFQPDLFMSLLSTLSGFIDVLYMLAGYLQAGLTLISSQNWLLSGVALIVVVMMGMWLRLMRYPREA